jgi:hypothetical protein
MAMQVCPRCKARTITWVIDEEVSPYTQWYCATCKYAAEEDESHESACPHCANAASFMHTRDSDGYHRWCWSCGAFEPTSEAFTACDA